MSEKLANVFDVPHEEVNLDISQTVIPAGEPEDVDFEIARGNYHEILDQGKAAINTAMRIAAETENPRAIEVLSGLLKNMADVNKQLVQMSKDRQDVKVAKKQNSLPNGGVNTPQIQSQNTVVFTGTSADLSKLLAAK